MKIGIYIDAANISSNGGYAMRYDLLKAYCLRGNPAIRLNTYLAYDEERASTDLDYRLKQQGYFSIIRNYGFKIITKPIKRYTNEEGIEISRANADLDMAVDMLIQAKNLDKVFLLTGDGDFRRAVQALQNMGVRLEVIAFRNVSRDIINECDFFTSGFIIPNLIPIEDQSSHEWGEVGTRVRGICYSIAEGYGFFRYMDLDYNFKQAFFHFSELPKGHYVKLESIYEFRLEQQQRGMVGVEITPVYQYR